MRSFRKWAAEIRQEKLDLCRIKEQTQKTRTAPSLTGNGAGFLLVPCTGSSQDPHEHFHEQQSCTLWIWHSWGQVLGVSNGELLCDPHAAISRVLPLRGKDLL